MSKPVQRDIVLQALKDAGGRGVHTFELRAQFIGNPSQRIAELEALGHRIMHRRERLRGGAIGTRYKLLPQEETGVDTTTRAGGGEALGLSGDRLFNPAGLSKPAGAYDDVEEAA